MLKWKLKCVELFCWRDFSHRGAKCLSYQGPNRCGLEYEFVLRLLPAKEKGYVMMVIDNLLRKQIKLYTSTGTKRFYLWKLVWMWEVSEEGKARVHYQYQSYKTSKQTNKIWRSWKQLVDWLSHLVRTVCGTSWIFHIHTLDLLWLKNKKDRTLTKYRN